MKPIKTLTLALLALSSIVSASPSKYVSSEIDGIIVLLDESDPPTERHFLNAAQIIVIKSDTREEGDPHFTIRITTSENRPVAERDGGAADSVVYYINFTSESEAKKALQEILSELRTALGTAKGAGRAK